MRRIQLLLVLVLLVLMSARIGAVRAQNPSLQEGDSLVSLSFSYSSVTGQGVTPDKDPWLQKPVLHYLLYSSLTGEAQDLFKTLSLSAEEVNRLKEIATEEGQQVRVLYWEAQNVVRGKDRSLAAQDIALYNEKVKEELRNADHAIRQLLGPRYPLFREWIREWWAKEVKTVTRLKQSAGTLSDTSMCYVSSVKTSFRLAAF